MSKSKGNFYTMEDIKEKGFSPMDLRLLFLSSHYRSQLNFTWKFLAQAQNNRKKIVGWLENLKNFVPIKIKRSPALDVNNYMKKFTEAMNDDLNTPLALSVLYKLITETNKLIAKNDLTSVEGVAIISFWGKINTILGLTIDETIEKIPATIISLAEKRKIAKINQDFKTADQLRFRIEEKNYLVEDLKNNEYLIKKQI